jgi:hypothetical protein
MFHRRGKNFAALLALGLGLGASSAARAEVPVQRTRFQIPSSNGFGAILLDLQQAKLTHFREHVFATEEPVIDQNGNDVWGGNGFLAVHTRDLLFDTYFGLRPPEGQRWLTSVPVDLDASGYAAWTQGKTGGTGVAVMVQHVGSLEATQYYFAPQSLPHAAFAMVMRVKNTGAQIVPGVQAFTQHNLHLGYGRPGVGQDINFNGETIVYDNSAGKADFLERAFAGVVVARPLGPLARHAIGTGAALYDIVNKGGAQDLPNVDSIGTADDSVSAYQFNLGDLGPGAEQWCGVAFAHHGDPFGGAAVQGWLDAYVAGRSAQKLVEDEIAAWSAYQTNVVKPPANLSADEETLVRHAGATLRMSQNHEEDFYLRQFLTNDGDTRRTRFMGALPGTVKHRGKGAVLASLPPGEWTYAWIRDGSYAVSAMAALGMKDEAKDGLLYYLNAEAGRFQTWDELKPYSMPPYQISLVRYHGFGVEETDFNDFGPNLEFDGFGLFLWALRNYEQTTGDTSVADGNWSTITTKIADVLVALVDPQNGLVRKDSSIWETHWKGRERSWAYTSITAARGLCDAAAIAERKGDAALTLKYRDAARAIRKAIAAKLTDGTGAIASNVEELGTGNGYYDAAVLDAIAMGLFDPQGTIAKATLKAMDDHLAVQAGAGWSRNDDRTDHAGGTDTSPWGSEYDSAEWVVTDLRGAIAERLAGDTVRADRLTSWVLAQSLKNYLMVAETYDEKDGTYKFNTPMAGFGAGAYVLALAQRAGMFSDPACGVYFEADGSGGSGGAGSSSSATGASTGAGTGGAETGTGGAGPGASSGSGASGPTGGSSSSGLGAGGNGNGQIDAGGCGCRTAGSPAMDAAAIALSALGLIGALGRRRRRG